MHKIGINTQKILLVLSTAMLIGSFLFLRLNNLPNTIKLYGDTARDLLTLQHWRETGKPPLLGPHTSALSFNQSAWYFYLLFPFYLLSGGSLYTANLAILVYYFALFSLGLWLVYKNKLSGTTYLILLTSITFHPELIKQTRDVWNPSLVLPAVIIAIGLLLKLKEKVTITNLFLLNAALFFPLGASYSIAPLVISFFAVATFYCFRQKLFDKTQHSRYLMGLIVFPIMLASVVNIGTIAYELRYGFLLTKNLGNQQVLQTSYNLAEKALNLGRLVLGSDQVIKIITVTIFVTASLTLALIPKFRPKFHPNFLLIVSLLLVNILLLLLLPFQIHAHYIFGVLGLFFVYLSLLPKFIRWFLLAFLLTNWLLPVFRQEYFQSVSPTAAQRQTCLKQVCQNHPGQIYVVTNSSSHDHQALGYEYLGKKIDCPAISILNLPGNQPQLMAVFNENTQFDLAKTDFYELNQFGKRQHLGGTECNDKLSVTVFNR